jgi:hypothetical protein
MDVQHIVITIIGGLIALYGLLGVVKRRMIAPWAIFARDRFIADAAANRSFTEPLHFKNYLIRGTYAVIEGIILLGVGVLIIVVNW